MMVWVSYGRVRPHVTRPISELVVFSCYLACINMRWSERTSLYCTKRPCKEAVTPAAGGAQARASIGGAQFWRLLLVGRPQFLALPRSSLGGSFEMFSDIFLLVSA